MSDEQKPARGKPGQPGNLNGVARGTSGSWKPGQSGNPSGRPALAKAWAAATGGKTMADVTSDALKIVYDRMMEGAERDHNGNPNDPDWRFAAQKVLEYSAGKPKETVVFEAPEDTGEPQIDWSKLPLDQRERLLAALIEIETLSVPASDTEH